MATALLIDDHLFPCMALRGTLAEAGLTVLGAEPGGDVLARAHELRPNLVLVALRLDGVDVPALCRALRADLACSGTAIVVVAGGRGASDVADESARITAAMASGADDAMATDEIPGVAVHRLRRLIQSHQLTAMGILNEQLAQVGRLVAGIVHEIRAPLTVIRGNAELMALELGEDHAAGVWFRPILRNARTLQTRLEHLMAAVRVGPSHPQPVDVVPLVQEAISLFEKGIDPCRGHVAVDLVLDPPESTIPPVLVDPGRLIQVVLNLLANAHDAILTERAVGRVEVRVKPKLDAPEVQIDVHDDGPGVGSGFLERIFEPFFTTKTDGTGYGLYLAAELLREHGGRLVACNHDRGGACFSIHLPVAPTLEPSSPPVG